MPRKRFSMRLSPIICNTTLSSGNYDAICCKYFATYIGKTQLFCLPESKASKYLMRSYDANLLPSQLGPGRTCWTTAAQSTVQGIELCGSLRGELLVFNSQRKATRDLGKTHRCRPAALRRSPVQVAHYLHQQGLASCTYLYYCGFGAREMESSIQLAELGSRIFSGPSGAPVCWSRLSVIPQYTSDSLGLQA